MDGGGSVFRRCMVVVYSVVKTRVGSFFIIASLGPSVPIYAGSDHISTNCLSFSFGYKPLEGFDFSIGLNYYPDLRTPEYTYDEAFMIFYNLYSPYAGISWRFLNTRISPFIEARVGKIFNMSSSNEYLSYFIDPSISNSDITFVGPHLGLGVGIDIYFKDNVFLDFAFQYSSLGKIDFMDVVGSLNMMELNLGFGYRFSYR